MSAKVFVDTNILVYARDSSELEKQEQALRWLEVLWQKRIGSISYQTLNEYYVIVTQRLKPGLSRSAAQEDIRHLLLWQPIPVDRVVIENAWIIQERQGFSWWDSLIVSAAQMQGCTFLLSEGLQQNQRIGNLQIINPFTSDIKILS